MIYFCHKSLAKDQTEPLDSDFLSHQQIHNKIQVFASSFALNDCFDDMHQIQKQGVVVVQYSKVYYSAEDFQFSIWIAKRSDMRNIAKQDYSVSRPAAHYFFEIPVVAHFTPEKILQWQKWCYKTLKTTLSLNEKKREMWLKKKNLEKDFD